MRSWWRRRDQDGLPVALEGDPGIPRVIDLRERSSGWAVHHVSSGSADNRAGAFRQQREAADAAETESSTTAPPWHAASSDRLAAAYAARRSRTSGTQPHEGTTRKHDTTQQHDTSKVHDTSRVHDTAKVHDTRAGRDEIDLRKPVARAAPQPSVAPEAPAARRDVDGPGADTPALAPWERSAWDDLDDQLASIQGQLRKPPPASVRAEPEPVPEVEPPSVREPTMPTGTPRPASSRPGRRHLVLIASVAVCLLLAVAAGLAIRTGGDDGSPDAPALTRQQSSQLAGWLRANTREGAVIAAPSDLRPVLEDGLRDRQVVAFEDHPQPGADLVVLPRGWQPAVPGLAVASLATGTRPVDVVQPRRDPARVEAQLARQVEAGGRLVESVKLRLTPRAWTMLANGKVDLGVASLLRRLLRAHTVEVSSFPRDPLATAAGAPARTVAITSLDGATPTAALVRAVRSPGARTHLGRDRGRPALVVDLPIAGQG